MSESEEQAARRNRAVDPAVAFWESVGAPTGRACSACAAIWENVVLVLPHASLSDGRGLPRPVLARFIVWLAQVGARRNEAMLSLALRHIQLLALIAQHEDEGAVMSDDCVTVAGLSLQNSERALLVVGWQAALKAGIGTTLADQHGRLMPEPARVVGRRLVRHRQLDFFAAAPSAEALIRDLAQGRMRRR